MTFCSLVISVSSRTPRPGAAYPDHSAPGLGSRFSLMTPPVRSSVDYCSFRDADQVVGCDREGEHRLGLGASADLDVCKRGLRLDPAEHLLDPLADPLADGVAGMPG